MVAEEGLWVFGYGSLMWRPGFDFEERTLAIVRGYRRALCVYSHVHRGTPERPGLIFALDRGGACKGVAFRVAPERAEETLAYLRAREQVTMVYLEVRFPIKLADGRRVEAVSYIADRRHAQYAGVIAPAEQARLVAQAVGKSGANPEYVCNTYAHMRELGIRDEVLEVLTRRLEAPDGGMDLSARAAFKSRG